MIGKYTLAMLVAALPCFTLHAQSELELVLTGLDGPVDVANAGDARLFIVERPGRIRILRPDGQLEATSFLDITDRVLSAGEEQGLLGLAFDPDYSSNGRFFVYYNTGSGSGKVRLSRFSVSADPDVADATQETILWEAVKPATNHNGGDLAFGPDGYLYITTGDGGMQGDPDNHAQDLGSFLGKILRIDVDGATYSIPSTNPFTGVAGALPEIWALGLRNPWRFGFDSLTGDLWIGDVGQGLREEVDRWPAGDNSGPNFGWRCYEGDLAYNTDGCQPQANYAAPVISQAHSDGWCSVIGGRMYRGLLYPSLQGKYIYTDYCHGRIHALQPNGATWNDEELINTGEQGMAAIGEDLDGELYFVNVDQGSLYRLIDTSAVVRISPKMILSGAWDGTAGLMRDDLRANGLVPTTEPYTGLGYPRIAKSGGEEVSAATLAVTGTNAVVDWVRVELRSSAHPEITVASCQGLLQRDGDVVAADGSSQLKFHVGPGNYFVAVRHRNHLGCMTASALALTAVPATVDLSSSSMAMWGTAARQNIGTLRALWPGNVLPDNLVRYTGASNDRDPILLELGGMVPTEITIGYLPGDLNMDGSVAYTGTGNDREIILSTIGGNSTTITVGEQLP